MKRISCIYPAALPRDNMIVYEYYKIMYLMSGIRRNCDLIYCTVRREREREPESMQLKGLSPERNCGAHIELYGKRENKISCLVLKGLSRNKLLGRLYCKKREIKILGLAF